MIIQKEDVKILLMLFGTYIIVMALFIFLLTSGIAHALNTGFVNGVYTVFCNEMCYDLIKNQSTKGYDPKFLSLTEVKENCKIVQSFNVSMGYCDKLLGTI